MAGRVTIPLTVTPPPLHTVLAVPRYAVQADRWNGRKAVCMTKHDQVLARIENDRRNLEALRSKMLPGLQSFERAVILCAATLVLARGHEARGRAHGNLTDALDMYRKYGGDV